MTSPPTIEAARFRRSPVITEAVRWDGTSEHALALLAWMNADPARGSVPDAASEYWLDDHAERLTMGLKSFGSTYYAEPGDWIVRAGGGVYVPEPDIRFSVLYAEVDSVKPDRRASDWFNLEMLTGAAALIIILAALNNGAFLWYVATRIDDAMLPTYVLAISVFFNAIFLILSGLAIRAVRKRVA